jgi:hypothetical protein
LFFGGAAEGHGAEDDGEDGGGHGRSWGGCLVGEGDGC